MKTIKADRYPSRVSPYEQFKDIRDTVLQECIPALAAGVDPFHKHGVIITENIENEYVSPDCSDIIVETEHVQEISWLFYEIRDKMDEVVAYYHKDEFFRTLAETANLYLIRSDDMYGLLMAVLSEAAVFMGETMQIKAQAIKDEVLACVGSLSDVAEKI